MASRRRGNGEGSIYQRADGRWVANITVGYAADGKRKRKDIYGRTKREVRDQLAVLQHQKATGTLCDAGKMTVAEWLAHWIEKIAKPNLAPTTFDEYSRIIRLHLTPHIGRIALAKLSAVNVQALYSEIQKGGNLRGTAANAHKVLCVSLNTAVRQGQIPINQCSRVDPPKYTPPEMKVLTAGQAMAVLSEAEGDRLHALMVLALTAGLRQGELFALFWEDIDLDMAMLSVRRTLTNVNGKLAYRRPKTKGSIRTLKLPAMAVEALHDHRAMMLREGHAGGNLVFCGVTGGPLRKPDFTTNYFKPLLKRAGVPDVRFHDLRHTSATLMLTGNVHPKIVQQRLGHSKVSMTLDTYSHVLPSMDAAAAGMFDQLLKWKA